MDKESFKENDITELYFLIIGHYNIIEQDWHIS